MADDDVIRAVWLGGPNDGEAVVLRPGIRYVEIMCAPPGRLWLGADEDDRLPFRRVTCPVERRADGSYAIRWPKDA